MEVMTVGVNYTAMVAVVFTDPISFFTRLHKCTWFELTNCRGLQEETFGPVVGIQKVSSDEEALKLMNDSPYGLTASIWTNAEQNTESEKAFLWFVDELQTGTVFLNR